MKLRCRLAPSKGATLLVAVWIAVTSATLCQATPVSAQSTPSASRASVLVAGLVVPGGGYFRTDRPIHGTVALVGASTALAWGMLSDRTHVRCNSPLVDNSCPAPFIATNTTSRPHLWAGVVGALAVVGATAAHAYLTTDVLLGTTASLDRDPTPLSVGLVDVAPAIKGVAITVARFSVGNR